MPENPLLPNKQLQKLYATMLRARDAASTRAARLEAIFATLALQLEAGDAIVPAAHGKEAKALAELFQPSRRAETPARVFTSSTAPLAFAAGVAAGAQLAGNSRLVVTFVDPGNSEANWAALFGQAQRDRLPLVIICPVFYTPGASEPDADGALTWTNLARVTKKLRFPILTVDGADAVAMYRAMQESVIRTRHGDGPALLWCLMPPPGAHGKAPASIPPMERLERYLAARRIALPKASRKP